MFRFPVPSCSGQMILAYGLQAVQRSLGIQLGTSRMNGIDQSGWGRKRKKKGRAGDRCDDVIVAVAGNRCGVSVGDSESRNTVVDSLLYGVDHDPETLFEAERDQQVMPGQQANLLLNDSLAGNRRLRVITQHHQSVSQFVCQS